MFEGRLIKVEMLSANPFSHGVGFPRYSKCNVPKSSMWKCTTPQRSESVDVRFFLELKRSSTNGDPLVLQEQKWETALAMVNLNNSIRHQIGSQRLQCRCHGDVQVPSVDGMNDEHDGMIVCQLWTSLVFPTSIQAGFATCQHGPSCCCNW